MPGVLAGNLHMPTSGDALGQQEVVYKKGMFPFHRQCAITWSKRFSVRHHRQGFTLLELLMVVAIVGVLLAVVVPVTVLSVRRAHQTQCLTNLHSLSLAMNLYVSDAEGYFPPLYGDRVGSIPGAEFTQSGKLWSDLLLAYLKTPVFPACPDRQALPGTDFLEEDNAELSGYFYNKGLGDIVVRHMKKAVVFRTVHEGQLSSPSRTVMIAEGRAGLLAASLPDVNAESVFGLETVTALKREDLLKLKPGSLRHGGGANYVFADGHVRWQTPANFQQVSGTSPTFSLFLASSP